MCFQVLTGRKGAGPTTYWDYMDRKTETTFGELPWILRTETRERSGKKSK
jgi:hypothetical protein